MAPAIQRKRGRPPERLRDAIVHDAYLTLLLSGIAPRRASSLLGRLAVAPRQGYDAVIVTARERERAALCIVVHDVLRGVEFPGERRALGRDAIVKACKRHRERFPMHGGPYDAARAWWRFAERRDPTFKPLRGKGLSKAERVPWVSRGDDPLGSGGRPQPTTLNARNSESSVTK